MKTRTIGKVARQPSIRGQGMTEYIIIVALIAIAAITVVGQFGGVVKAQFGAMAAELGGGDGSTASGDAKTLGDDAASAVGGANTLDAYTD